VAHSLNLLGNLMQYQRKDYAEAEKLYTKSLRIRCKYYSRHSERVGQTLNNLAALARAQGQPERAERLLVECLEIREKVSGGVHPETHKTAQQLMQLYRNQGRTEDVARIRKMLTGWQRQGGGVDADANWLRAQVKFGIENVPVGFKLHSRIVGMRNYLLKNIVRESGAQQVYLGSVKPDAEEAPPEELSVSTSGADGVSLCMPSPIAPSEAAKASFQGSVPASAAASSPIAASSNTQSLVELPTCAEHGPSSEWHHVSASRFSMSRDSLPSKPSLISASRGSSVRSDSSSSSDPPTTGPVALHIVAVSEAALQKAEVLCRRHLDAVKSDFAKWLQGETLRPSNARRGQSDTARSTRSAAPSGPTLADFMTKPPARNRTK